MLTKREAALLYKALVCHDGPSLRPDWDREHQKELTVSLDKLRAELMDHSSGKEA
jgi:hypothetical protein